MWKVCLPDLCQGHTLPKAVKKIMVITVLQVLPVPWT